MPRRGVFDPLLKWCLPKNGLNWGTQPWVLARSPRDAKVMKALKALGVRGKTREVQDFFCDMFRAATKLVNRRQLPAGLTLAEFCFVLGRNNVLARNMNNVVVFLDLFEALIFGRARYIQRGEEIGWANPPTIPPCPLALAIDAFVLAAPFVSWESERALVAADVDDVTEIRFDEEGVAFATSAQAGGSGAADLLSLAEEMNALGVPGADEEEEEADDDDDDADDDDDEPMEM